MTKFDYKQVILVRSDLKLSKGKMAAQVAHGAVDAYVKSDQKLRQAWLQDGQKKTVLRVENEKELREHFRAAKDAGLTAVLITDAGHTHLEPGTATVCAIGPDSEERIDKITGDLKLVN